MLSQDLQELGFSDKETKILLALNEYGAMPASTISRVTGIQRTSVYNLINPLREKNIITSYRQGTNTFYVIDDLNKLYFLQKAKVMKAKEVIIQLQKCNSNLQNIQVNYYRGQEGYFEVYRDMLQIHPSEIMCWVDFRFLSIIKPEDEEEYVQERIRQNLPARILMTESEGARCFKKNDPSLKRETRLLGKEFTFETTIFLYDGYVAIFDFHEPITAIRIHHPGLYKMFVQIFNMHWSVT